MMEMQPMDSVLNEIKKLALSVEVHLKKVSDKNETLDTKIAFEYYRQAYLKEDTFKSYRTYDPELLLKWGIVADFSVAQKWGEDPTLIPESLRDLVLMYQRKHVVETYVEKNEYIRVKIGLPTLEETENKDFVYASDEFYNKYGLDRKPLHELQDIDVVRLRKSGELDSIMSDNPTKKYLKYIGDQKLDLISLKTASNFQLMRVDEKLDRKLLSEFTKLYEQSRTYMVNVTYVNDYSNRYDHYDSYMGLLILTMTIQRLCVNTFKVGIDRDFYDATNLKMLFESYNMPFIDDLPIEYQRVLARNLNRLLRYKSSDRVLYDVAEILGFNSAEFYKYFLVKQHKFVDGEPVFAYKTVTDDEGNEHQVYDYEKMYDVYFQGINMKEVNESSALTDTSTRMSYADMTIDDEFWWDGDDELRKVLYDTEYNIIESKYIGVHIMYRLTEMIHEVARFFRLVIDNAEAMRTIYIKISNIKSEVPLSYLETIVLAICLICKRNNMRGEIITTPSKTLTVLGFNFRADFDMIRQHLDKNRDLIDHEKIYNLIKDLSMTSVEDINTVYSNIKELWEFLIDKMSRAKTIEEFNAYEKLYKTLHYTEDLATVFTMSNGKVAETYLEYLQDLNEELALFVETADDQTILVALENIIYSLEDEITDLVHLDILNEGSSIMVNALKTLVVFFKSYTIDLKHLSIIYVMDNRYYNMIKLISQIKNIDAQLTVGDTLDRMIHKLHLLVNLFKNDDAYLRFTSSIHGTLFLESLTKLIDDIMIYAKYDLYDNMRITSSEFLMGNISDEMSIRLSEMHSVSSDIIGASKISGINKHSVDAACTVASDGTLSDDTHISNMITVYNPESLINGNKLLVESILTLKGMLGLKNLGILEGNTDMADIISTHEDEHLITGIDVRQSKLVSSKHHLDAVNTRETSINLKNTSNNTSVITTGDKVSNNDNDHIISNFNLVEESIVREKYHTTVNTVIDAIINFKNLVNVTESTLYSSGKIEMIDILNTISDIMLDVSNRMYDTGFIKSTIDIPSFVKIKDRYNFKSIDSKSSLSELEDIMDTGATINSDDTGHPNNSNLLSKHELLIIREE